MGLLDRIRNIFGANDTDDYSSESPPESTELEPIWVILEDDGFKIVDQADILREVKWNQISEVMFSRQNLRFKSNSDETFIIPSGYFNWYQLIQIIPARFEDYDRVAAQQLMDSMYGCEVCGLLAVETNYCLSCKSEIWIPQLADQWGDRQNYTMEMQIGFFAPWEADEEIVIKNIPKDGFKADPNWIPLVTKEHIERRKTSHNM